MEENEINRNDAQDKKEKKKKAPAILRFLQGALIGVGGILPGISGGVLCAIFGLYQPLMEVLAHPMKNLKKHFRLLCPVVIGLAFGFVGLAKAVQVLLGSHEMIAVALFLGLILGMMPSLWQEAGEKGPRTKNSYLSLGIAFFLFTALFLFLHFAAAVNVNPNGWWFFFSGALEGVGLIVPGLSASATLIFFGLLEPLMAIIGSFPDHLLAFLRGKETFAEAWEGMQILPALCVLAGILLVVVLFSRAVNKLMEKHASVLYHGIFGIVLATTVGILVELPLKNPVDVLLQLICAVGGFLAAWLLDKMSRKILS